MNLNRKCKLIEHYQSNLIWFEVWETEEGIEVYFLDKNQDWQRIFGVVYNG
jgi:hypothetical protein